MKFKTKDGKGTIIARDETQASAFINYGLEFASKEDEAKYKKLKEPKK